MVEKVKKTTLKNIPSKDKVILMNVKPILINFKSKKVLKT